MINNPLLLSHTFLNLEELKEWIMEGLKTSRYRLTGISPIIFHNGQLANPRNPFTKAMKEINAKKNKKTEADIDRLSELEFKGGLYVNEKKEPIMPAEGIEAVVRAGAKCSKEGKVVQAGVFCLESAVLEYEGPKDPDGLWNDERFVSVAKAKVGQSSIMRTRPIFHEWAVDIELHFNPEVCNEEQIYKWLRVAGEQCGAFDWRPRYGRFTVERLADRDQKAA